MQNVVVGTVPAAELRGRGEGRIRAVIIAVASRQRCRRLAGSVLHHDSDLNISFGEVVEEGGGEEMVGEGLLLLPHKPD